MQSLMDQDRRVNFSFERLPHHSSQDLHASAGKGRQQVAEGQYIGNIVGNTIQPFNSTKPEEIGQIALK